MLVDNIADHIISDTGLFFDPSLTGRTILSVCRDFCEYTLFLNKSVQGIVSYDSAILEKNYAQPFAIAAIAGCEPVRVYGLSVNGYKMSCEERDAVSPSGASAPIYHPGGIYYEFSDPTTCLIHPLHSGGDVRFMVGFRPSLSAVEIPDELYSRKASAIEAGVKARLLSMPGYSSFNAQMSGLFMAEYVNEKRKARAEVNRTIIGEMLR